MSTENRFMLNRPFQQVERTPDWIDRICTFRSVAGTNLVDRTKGQDSEKKLNIGKKSKDDVFTINVEYLQQYGIAHTRVSFIGSMAEQVLALNLQKGEQLKVTGHLEAHINENTFRIDRSGVVVYALGYSLVSVRKIAGTEQV